MRYEDGANGAGAAYIFKKTDSELRAWPITGGGWNGTSVTKETEANNANGSNADDNGWDTSTASSGNCYW